MLEVEKLRGKILIELLKQFPDLNPKIAEISEKKFTYELERNDNYTYYSVRYSITPHGELTVDWESAELTMI